jgi:hypothetical protein
MQHPPEYILLENVVGFEGSRMRSKLAAALAAIGLDMQACRILPLLPRLLFLHSPAIRPCTP